jgi:class 3 adenylate cyclase
VAGPKLTTIVAIDVDGFSAMAEANEAAAIAAVARLGERCKASAAAHGGRIFNTSGDAVMMEFSSTSAAAYAASELAVNPDPPIRVGVHVGEATEMPTGDLIGRGVSVAAQLQDHARPGHVLVSESAKEALRGPLARRLVSKGSIKLEKLGESTHVYELTPDQSDLAKPVSRRRMVIIGAATLAALVVLALLAWPLLAPAPPMRVAVLSFATADDPELEGIASGVAEDITTALNAGGVRTLAREAPGARDQQLAQARRAGAPLAVEGLIEVGENNAYHARISITRTSDRSELWAGDVVTARTPDSRPGFRRVTAQRATDMMRCAIDAWRELKSAAQAETLSLFLHACADATSGSPQRAGEALRQVVAQAPSFGLPRAMLALQTATDAQTASAAQRDALREQARREAERALRDDAYVGEAYVALDMIEQRRNWTRREDLLEEGLAQDEFNPELNARYASVLAELGRLSDALTYARRASAFEPLSTSRHVNVGFALLQNGDAEAARDVAHDPALQSASDGELWLLRLRVAFWSGNYDDALALIDAPASEVRSTRARQCWRQAADAMRSQAGAPARAAGVRNVVSCARSGDLAAQQALMMLVDLGALDEAYALARLRFVDEGKGGEEVLFAPAMRAMRNDARFMPLMKEIGLLRHWRLSGRWPDFCREPSLPYRCEAEAQRLL